MVIVSAAYLILRGLSHADHFPIEMLGPLARISTNELPCEPLLAGPLLAGSLSVTLH